MFGIVTDVEDGRRLRAYAQSGLHTCLFGRVALSGANKVQVQLEGGVRLSSKAISIAKRQNVGGEKKAYIRINVAKRRQR